MTRAQINLSITDETRDELDMLVMETRRMTGLETSRTTIITVLVKEAAARLEARSLKRIEPIRNAKGKLTGWRAIYDGYTVGTFDGAASKLQAEQALDRYVYEELSK